jgi:glycosyltransferase involved in cell wall biosynthesis
MPAEALDHIKKYEHMNSFVSIVVPLYNRVELVGETIASVQGQTYPHWELIVVDDGSTDGSDVVVRAYADRDERIKLHYRDRGPKGAPTCRNIGVEKSTGAYVIFLDSDDLLAPFCLEHRLEKFAECPNEDFLVFPIAIFNTVSGEAYRLWNHLVKPGSPEDLDRCLSTDTPWQTSGPIWKRETLQRLGPWLEGVKCRQDLEFHVRALSLRFSYRKFPEVYDCFYRRSIKAGQISKNDFTRQEYILSKNEMFGVLHDHLVRNGRLNLFRTQMLAAYYIENALGNYLYQQDIALRVFVQPLRRLALLHFSDKARTIGFLGMLYLLQAILSKRYSLYFYYRFRFLALPAFFRPNRYDREVPLTDEHREKYLQRLKRNESVRFS